MAVRHSGAALAMAALLSLLPAAALGQPPAPPDGIAPDGEPQASRDHPAGENRSWVLDFNPWLGIRAVALGVERGKESGDYVDTRPDVLLNLNIGGRDYGKTSGFFLAARLVPMNLNRQESFSGVGKTEDYGTSIRGFFLYAIPSYALRPAHNMEFFGGVGLGYVRVSGDIALCCAGFNAEQGGFRKVSLNMNRVIFPAFHIGWRLGYFLAFASIMFFDDGANRISALDTGLFAVFSVSIPLGI